MSCNRCGHDDRDKVFNFVRKTLTLATLGLGLYNAYVQLMKTKEGKQLKEGILVTAGGAKEFLEANAGHVANAVKSVVNREGSSSLAAAIKKNQ